MNLMPNGHTINIEDTFRDSHIVTEVKEHDNKGIEHTLKVTFKRIYCHPHTGFEIVKVERIYN